MFVMLENIYVAHAMYIQTKELLRGSDSNKTNYLFLISSVSFDPDTARFDKRD